MNEVWFVKENGAPKESASYRLQSHGAGGCSTVELLGILTGKVKKSETPEETARGVLSAYGTLRQLAGADVRALGRVASLTAAVKIMAAMELAKRLTEEEVRLAETLSGADEAYKFLKPRIADLPHEVFAAIFLNQKHGVIAYRELFRGSVHDSAVHPREVVKESLRENAAAIILAHNHPSGHVSPSPDDLRLTEELKKVLQAIDVRVVDHLILGGNGYFSFAREGLLC